MIKDKLNTLTFIIVIVGIIILFSITGCAEKTVTQYKYIKQPCPRLTVYQGCDDNYSITIYKKNNFICVGEWNNSCIPRNSFMKLYHHMRTVKQACANYKFEVEQYNKKFAK